MPYPLVFSISSLPHEIHLPLLERSFFFADPIKMTVTVAISVSIPDASGLLIYSPTNQGPFGRSPGGYERLDCGHTSTQWRDWKGLPREDQPGEMTRLDAQLLLTTDQLLQLLRLSQCQWRQRYQLQGIGLFGSTARNQATAGRDVDVGVELDPVTPFAMVHLKQELEALLQRTVDLVRLRERMNLALRQAISREGVSA